jgi:hypothetical protein
MPAIAVKTMTKAAIRYLPPSGEIAPGKTKCRMSPPPMS